MERRENNVYAEKLFHAHTARQRPVQGQYISNPGAAVVGVAK